jgi:hypothetical protein
MAGAKLDVDPMTTTGLVPVGRMGRLSIVQVDLPTPVPRVRERRLVQVSPVSGASKVRDTPVRTRLVEEAKTTPSFRSWFETRRKGAIPETSPSF